MANVFQRAVRKLVGGAPVGAGSFWQRLLTPDIESTAELANFFSGYSHAAITVISDAVSRAEFYVEEYNTRTEEVSERPNHPFIKLLRNPNDHDSQFLLMEKSDTDYSFFGEYFWFIVRGEKTGLPLQFHRLNPVNMMEVIAQDNAEDGSYTAGELIGWRFQGYAGEPIALALNDVLHVKNHNPRNPYRGWGVMQATINQILIEKHGTEFTRNFLANNAFPGGVFTLKDKIAKENFDKFKEDVRQAYTGTGNAGKLMVLNAADAEFTKLGSTLADVGLRELQETTTTTILNMFRVPKQKIGEADSTLNRSTAQVLETMFAKDTVTPRLERFEDGIQRVLDEYATMQNRARQNKIQLKLKHRSIIPEDIEQTLEVIKVGRTHQFLSRNEARTMIPGELRSVEGGDAVEQEVHASGEPKFQPFSEPAKVKSHNGKVTVKKTVKKAKPKKKQPAITYDEFAAYRRDKWEELLSDEKQIKDKLDSFYGSQLSEVKSRIKPKAFDNVLFDADTEGGKLKELLLPSFEQAGRTQFNLASRTAAEVQGKAYEDYAAQLAGFIADRLDLFVTSSMTGLKKRLEGILAQATLEGLTATEVARQVESAYGEMTSAKALVIASTELNAIANEAAATAYREQGFSYKQWFANPGACEICRGLDGKIVGIDSVYAKVGEQLQGADGKTTLNNNFADIKEPPCHPHCKCDLIPANEVATPFGKLPPLSDREVLA